MKNIFFIFWTEILEGNIQGNTDRNVDKYFIEAMVPHITLNNGNQMQTVGRKKNPTRR